MSENECFVICPIGENGSDIRKWSDLTFKYVISPVVKEAGYKPLRADLITESGAITNQIIEKLIDAPLVIADLTDRNPNVFYELAIRHAVEKPYIQMIKCGQSVPFDINVMRTIFFDVDLEQAEKAKKELKEQIESIAKFKATNPITLAKNNAALQGLLKREASIKSENISSVIIESMSELITTVNGLRAEIVNMQKSSSYSNKSSLDEIKYKESLENERKSLTDKLTLLQREYIEVTNKMYQFSKDKKYSEVCGLNKDDLARRQDLLTKEIGIVSAEMDNISTRINQMNKNSIFYSGR